MTYKTLDEVPVWQDARRLNKDLFPVLRNLGSKNQFELRSQMERSAGSIMDNIAEGFERDGNKEFVQFLAVAKGSAGELKSQLVRATDRELIEKSEAEVLLAKCDSVLKQLGGLMIYLRNTDILGQKFIGRKK